MNLWPFRRTEKRESSYTDTLVAQIVARAGATIANPNATGALESGAGLVARSFAAAAVAGPDGLTGALSPACLAMAGRALIRSGEIVFAIDVQGDRVMLRPSHEYDVFGGYDPDTWTYRLNLAGPSRFTTRTNVPAAGVVHLMYMQDPERPWRGVGPLQSAALAGKLSAETVSALADEASGPRGYLLPTPKDGDDPTIESLKADIRKLRGAVALVESTSSEWGGGDSRTSPRGDWEAKRLGASPPASLVSLTDTASREVLAAIGLNPALFSAGDGTAARESWRQALFGVIAPLGRIVESELRAKLDPGISLTWDELRASDLSGRARAFQSMVGAGMDIARAASLSGLTEPE